jgi:hypothetical protein
MPFTDVLDTTVEGQQQRVGRRPTRCIQRRGRPTVPRGWRFIDIPPAGVRVSDVEVVVAGAVQPPITILTSLPLLRVAAV